MLTPPHPPIHTTPRASRLQRVGRVDFTQAHALTRRALRNPFLTRIFTVSGLFFCFVFPFKSAYSHVRHVEIRRKDVVKLLWAFLTPPKPFCFVNFAAVVLAQVCPKMLHLMNSQANDQQRASAAHLCAVTCAQPAAWHLPVSKDVGTFPTRCGSSSATKYSLIQPVWPNPAFLPP